MALLSKLLEKITYECVRGTLDRDVSDIIYDSRKVTADCMFVCIPGAKADGHVYAEDAVKAGAAVLLVEREVSLPEGACVTVIRVEDTRYAMAFISAAYFEYPAEKMQIIGITGTKGKTTTTYLVKSILSRRADMWG